MVRTRYVVAGFTIFGALLLLALSGEWQSKENLRASQSHETIPQKGTTKRNLAYARFPKTGSRYAIMKLKSAVPGIFIVPEKSPLHAFSYASDPHTFVLGSARNPCSAYVSLWAFQSSGRQHGLMHGLYQKSPADYDRIVGRHAKDKYSGPEDVRRFREWLKFFAHPSHKLGLLSARFHSKYISADKDVDILSDPDLAKGRSNAEAAKMAEELRSMEINDLVDCWLRTESLDSDMARCLSSYKSQGGQVKTTNLIQNDAFGASEHGPCSLYFDKETEDLVWQIDGPLFQKFGYTQCCAEKPSRAASSASAVSSADSVQSAHRISSGQRASEPPFAWQWGLPFQNAVGRPLDEHGFQLVSADVYGHAAGDCVAYVRQPGIKTLGLYGMVTVSTMREALDIEMLSCLRSLQLPISPDLAHSILYQVVLSGLSGSCEWILRNVKGIDPLKSFSDEAAAWLDENARAAVQAKGSAKYYGRPPYGKPQQQRLPAYSMNAVQLAITVGDAQTLKVLADSSSVIDSSGRTVADYVRAPGSPIAPQSALEYLGVYVQRQSVEHKMPTDTIRCDGINLPSSHLGWSQESALEQHDRCDFDIVDSLTRREYETRYREMGRPVLVRNFVPAEERCIWARHRVVNDKTRHTYGPTAYPPITGTKHCSQTFTVEEAEHELHCTEHPTYSNYHASHSPGPFTDILSTESYRKLRDIIFGVEVTSQQYFWGGDKSGATMHFHEAAFNFLWVGQKEWFLTPPTQAVWAGIPSFQLWNRTGIDMNYISRCTQNAGDLLLLPDGWGHATMSRGFSAGIGVLFAQRATKPFRSKHAFEGPRFSPTAHHGIGARVHGTV
eukprot:TRINITY_DN35055_c0_g1_i1.p1 TRINITY_DN35055_c0_g1~~TRINITY_DN35055_c0_g1_i1.p1  ORF type:complete len:839 (+),score=99.99 TRINITY_DN35055_c0_g1_i1:98-2614(+)